MSNKNDTLDLQAVQDFRNARLQANMEKIRAALQGKSADLLSYDDVRKKLRATETNQRELREIPLDAIVGSVGRYTDFTRHFSPQWDESKSRWTRVRTKVDGMTGLPPIEVYQIGEVYFVIDGNHRVSVAHSLESPTIEAYVTKVNANILLSNDVNPDDLIIFERYAYFLESTGLDQSVPGIYLRMSAAGNYRFLAEQIKIHQKWLGKKVTYQQAAKDWYKTIYWPVIQIIRRGGMIRDFPNRTETDLYVWIEKHREFLGESLGWSLEADAAAEDLSINYSKQPKSLWIRFRKKLYDVLTPDALETGPMPGTWRKACQETHLDTNLFRHILVAINGKSDGWNALKQALHFAGEEKSTIFGLHFAPLVSGKRRRDDLEVSGTFNQFCYEAGIAGELRVEKGNVTRGIINHARWVDLVVVSLAYPPGPRIGDRYNSKFRQLLRRCPRPVLAVPRTAHGIQRILLAFDGSPTSKEALFIAAYITKHWGKPLSVLSVKTKQTSDENLDFAKEYLVSREVEALYFHRDGDPVDEILSVAKQTKSDLILMGSYSKSPFSELFRGSSIDRVLRKFSGAVLICR